LKPKAGLVPKAKDPLLPRFLKTLFLITGEIYPTFTFADLPEEWVSSKKAQDELKTAIGKFRKELWSLIEDETPRRAKWVLGSRFSALDLYVAVMTNWGPGRDWFAGHCPKLAAIARRVESHPRLKPVWKRNDS